MICSSFCRGWLHIKLPQKSIGNNSQALDFSRCRLCPAARPRLRPLLWEGWSAHEEGRFCCHWNDLPRQFAASSQEHGSSEWGLLIHIAQIDGLSGVAVVPQIKMRFTLIVVSQYIRQCGYEINLNLNIYTSLLVLLGECIWWQTELAVSWTTAPLLLNRTFETKFRKIWNEDQKFVG